MPFAQAPNRVVAAISGAFFLNGEFGSSANGKMPVYSE